MPSKTSKSKAKLEQGTLTLDNGCVYEGELLNGVCQGIGTLTHPEGFRYEGQFKNGFGFIKLVFLKELGKQGPR